ncbi:hypothetical protein C8J56DRAFT_780109 [Mycena floridula]|nr:hypothetical protein C8J56DRAFT_780109 [Mycena floridula]
MSSELAHVVLLVILFQRFSETDWGSSVLCSRCSDGTTSFKVADRYFSANICRADLRTFDKLAIPVLQSGHESKFFMKASFRDASLKTEAAMIAKCYDLADGDPMIIDHLPSVVVAQDFPDSSTSKMRNLLGIPSHKPTSLQILVFDWLDPITNLKGEQFWLAFWDIIRCHFLLWQRGMQHRDVSVNNIRYNPVTRKGVLNDYDLALFIYDEPSPPSRRRPTGTIPFMAIALLEDSGWEGYVRRLYRHDLESFAWVLLWICVRFQNGREGSGPLDKFLTNDHQHGFCSKLSPELPTLEPTPDYKSCFLPAVVMVAHWVRLATAERARRDHLFLLALMPPGGPTNSISEDPVEKDDVEHLKRMVTLIKEQAGIVVDLGIPLSN